MLFLTVSTIIQNFEFLTKNKHTKYFVLKYHKNNSYVKLKHKKTIVLQHSQRSGIGRSNQMNHEFDPT